MNTNQADTKEVKKLVLQFTKEIDEQIIDWGAEDIPQIQELRKRVFFIHAMSDRQVELRCLDHIFKSILPSSVDKNRITEEEYTRWSNIIGGIMDSLTELRYKQKLTHAKKLGAINQEEFNILSSFNTLRNQLAHQGLKDKKMARFAEDSEYLEAIKLTRDVSIFCRQFGFPWIEEYI